MPHAPYQPIACSLYDLYEIAILHGAWLNVVWIDGPGLQEPVRVKPVGLQTCGGQEFLVFQRHPSVENGAETARLDRIRIVK